MVVNRKHGQAPTLDKTRPQPLESGDKDNLKEPGSREPAGLTSEERDMGQATPIDVGMVHRSQELALPATAERRGPTPGTQAPTLPQIP